MYLKNLGPFIAYAQVHTKFTKESLTEILKEFRGIGGAIPVQGEELEETKKYIMRGYPKEFETIGQISGKLVEMVEYNLSKDYFSRYIPLIEAVKAEEAIKAGRTHIHPDKLLLIVVGDVAKIEQGIRELNLGGIHYLDLNGNLIKH